MYNSYSPTKPRPKSGYQCKICGKQGGEADSHWFQLCPMRGEQNSNHNYQAPRKGYFCKFCHKPGGEADSHWFQQCPYRIEFEGMQVPHPLKIPPGGMHMQPMHNMGMLQVSPNMHGMMIYPGVYGVGPTPGGTTQLGQIYYLQQQQMHSHPQAQAGNANIPNVYHMNAASAQAYHQQMYHLTENRSNGPVTSTMPPSFSIPPDNVLENQQTVQERNDNGTNPKSVIAENSATSKEEVGKENGIEDKKQDKGAVQNAAEVVVD
mmetsp:Transcript_22091/g.26961  ORF Transcript_22091/g.26961 Transcript_22091/m.26961 type:complete len:263 (+) Transcript_22091:48-836(+)